MIWLRINLSFWIILGSILLTDQQLVFGLQTTGLHNLSDTFKPFALKHLVLGTHFCCLHMFVNLNISHNISILGYIFQ